MIKYLYISFLIILTFTLQGCEKSYEVFTPDTNLLKADTTWSNLGGNFAQINQLHDSLSYSSTNTMADSFLLQTDSAFIQFPGNIVVVIPHPSKTLFGNVTMDGSAQIELAIYSKKGELISIRKPSSSNGYLLETGVVINLRITKQGQPLNINNGYYILISIPGLNNNIKYDGYSGSQPINGENYNWSKDNSIYMSYSQNEYKMATQKLGWVQCASLKDTSVEKTRIVLTMPTEFTNANTNAFIVYKNSNSITQFYADPTNRIWIQSKVPVNTAVTYVTITKKNDTYWLGTQNATTARNQNIKIKPEQKTLIEIQSFLKSL